MRKDPTIPAATQSMTAIVFTGEWLRSFNNKDSLSCIITTAKSRRFLVSYEALPSQSHQASLKVMKMYTSPFQRLSRSQDAYINVW